jgi:DUF1016 N-terminal domain
MNLPQPLAHYSALLAEVKQRIRHAQTRAVLAVNAELIRLYWEIGQMLDSRQTIEGWGAAVIPRLALDIRATACGTNRVRRKSATSGGTFQR